MRRLSFLSILLAAPPAMAQAVRYVDNIGACAGLSPCHREILEAWNAASPSDTIAVFPGVYPAASLSGKSDISLQAHHKEARPLIAPSLTLQGVANVRVADFVVAGAVTVYGSFEVIFEGNRVTSIWFAGGVGATLRRNVVTAGPIRMERPGSDFLIEENVLLGGGIILGMAEEPVQRGVVRANIVLGGGISIVGENMRGNTIEANWTEGGGIAMNGSGMGPLAFENTIRANIVRGGGISMSSGSGFGGAVSTNQIERNVVWASPGKGISLSASTGGGVVANEVELNLVFLSGEDGIYVNNSGAPNPNVFRRNVSLLNAGCDANDASASPDVWVDNRFGTVCGSATRSD